MPLTPEAMNVLRSLSEPIDKSRQPEFVEAVTAKLEAAGEIGPGLAHRAARSVLGQFWQAPPDLRQGRLGPRGSRS
jgi:hypothetical protein